MEADLFCSDWIGKVDPDGTVVTQEIAEGAQHILDDLLLMVSRFGGYRYLLIEQRVNMTRIHPTHNWGTLDLALYNPTLKVLVVSDLKFGFGLVRAAGNLQMIDYVEGLYESFAMPMDTTVHIRIVQPFAFAPWGPVDEWVGQLSDLIPYFQKLATKAQEAFTNPTLTAGAHCRYCPANVDCPAARQYVYLWGSVSDMPYQMDRMSADDKAREINLLRGIESLVKARREALEDGLTADVGKGVPCSVKALQSAPGRLKWDDGKELGAIAAFTSIGLDIRSPLPVTPTQAIQRAPKGLKPIAEKMVASMATRNMTTKLVDREDSIVSLAFGPNV